MSYNYVIIRYHGTIYRVPKTLFETEEIAQDRAWFVAKKIDSMDTKNIDQKTYDIILNESLVYANKKYLRMEY